MYQKWSDLSQKKKIAWIFMIVALMINIGAMIERREADDIIKILNNYDKTNKIIIKTDSDELVITDDEKVNMYKKNLEVVMYTEMDKKLLNKDIIKLVIEIKFYIDDEILFAEKIYSLKPNTKIKNYFEIYNSKFIAKIKGRHCILEITDDIFADIFEEE